MQEYSKGSTLDIDQDKEKSAFKAVSSRGFKHSTSSRSEKRDSGYLTDNSPANFGNNATCFTFDTGDSGVGSRGVPLHPSVDEDEEVEMVLNSPSPMGRPSKPIPIQRPRAPLPLDMLDTGPSHESEDDDVFENASNVCDVFTMRRFRHHAHHFRPIHGRTVGTQTPSLHGLAITETINVISDRFHPYQQPPIARGTAYARLRYHSDGDDSNSPTHGRDLPDIVPVPRDRSISLPDVHHQQRLDVGRELRRIGDEFHFELASAPPRVRRNGVVMRQASSFPGTTAFNFQNWWEQLRTIFSSPVNIDPDHPRRRASSSADPSSFRKDFWRHVLPYVLYVTTSCLYLWELCNVFLTMRKFPTIKSARWCSEWCLRNWISWQIGTYDNERGHSECPLHFTGQPTSELRCPQWCYVCRVVDTLCVRKWGQVVICLFFVVRPMSSIRCVFITMKRRQTLHR